ncbi:head-tail adaptor protein [Cognatishimia sp. D5M38]|uniref:Head-tail adaptor protein n=1 Tax=Cognatishimia coralii TaxID=3083254 RepID=A0ABU8QBP5_9RHOB
MSLPNLNRLLALEAPTQVADGAGGFSETWAVLGSLWAEVKPRTGRDREREAVGTARVEYRITVRALPVGQSSRPTPGQRFREGVRLFRIVAVADQGAEGRFLTCFAREEVAA